MLTEIDYKGVKYYSANELVENFGDGSLKNCRKNPRDIIKKKKPESDDYVFAKLGKKGKWISVPKTDLKYGKLL
jgi:hypothetical protein